METFELASLSNLGVNFSLFLAMAIVGEVQPSKLKIGPCFYRKQFKGRSIDIDNPHKFQPLSFLVNFKSRN